MEYLGFFRVLAVMSSGFGLLVMLWVMISARGRDALALRWEQGWTPENVRYSSLMFLVICVNVSCLVTCFARLPKYAVLGIVIVLGQMLLSVYPMLEDSGMSRHLTHTLVLWAPILAEQLLAKKKGSAEAATDDDAPKADAGETSEFGEETSSTLKRPSS